MYITGITVNGSKQYPLATSMIYQLICDKYNLPELDLLMKSLKSDVQWPQSQFRMLVDYIDPLNHDSDLDVFQVRFATTLESRELVSIFLSIDQGIIKNLTFVFPGRSGRGAGTHVIASIKSVSHQLGIRPDDLEFEIQGYPEGGLARYIREHSLNAFVWIDAINRYVHAKENVDYIPDMKSQPRRESKSRRSDEQK